jgi:S1-C subfamily serine protease
MLNQVVTSSVTDMNQRRTAGTRANTSATRTSAGRTSATRIAARIAMLATLVAPAIAAQRTPARPTPPRAPAAPATPDWSGPMRFSFTTDADRGYLGLTPRTSSGPSDTLGLLVDDVDENLPAAKAGIERGTRLVSIDGTDLRLDPRDLGDPAAEALPETRLRRILGNHKPGDEVSMVVLHDGRTDTKRVALAESPMARSIRSISQGRRMLGIGFSERGSMRDTSGLLVTSLTRGGAAEKAGLLEGDRVLSIDGVDLRVPSADAGTSEGVQARVARLRRTLDAVKDSAPVWLDILSEGRVRSVQLTPTWSRGFFFDMDRIRGMADDVRMNFRSNLDDETRDARADRDDAHRDAADRVHTDRVDTDRDDADRDDSDRDDAPVRGIIRGRTESSTMTLAGLSLAVVDLDFARQFGRGGEDGALVVRARREWEPLRAGDMILTIEGRPVRSGSSLDITIDRGRDQRFVVLRSGKRETVIVPAAR